MRGSPRLCEGWARPGGLWGSVGGVIATNCSSAPGPPRWPAPPPGLYGAAVINVSVSLLAWAASIPGGIGWWMGSACSGWLGAGRPWPWWPALPSSNPTCKCLASPWEMRASARARPCHRKSPASSEPPFCLHFEELRNYSYQSWMDSPLSLPSPAAHRGRARGAISLLYRLPTTSPAARSGAAPKRVDDDNPSDHPQDTQLGYSYATGRLVEAPEASKAGCPPSRVRDAGRLVPGGGRTVAPGVASGRRSWHANRHADAPTDPREPHHRGRAPDQLDVELFVEPDDLQPPDPTDPVGTGVTMAGAPSRSARCSWPSSSAIGLGQLGPTETATPPGRSRRGRERADADRGLDRRLTAVGVPVTVAGPATASSPGATCSRASSRGEHPRSTARASSSGRPRRGRGIRRLLDLAFSQAGTGCGHRPHRRRGRRRR